MYELSHFEIDEVSGGKGFFETIGEWFDNPGTSLGKFADFLVREASGSLEGAWATAKIG